MSVFPANIHNSYTEVFTITVTQRCSHLQAVPEITSMLFKIGMMRCNGITTDRQAVHVIVEKSAAITHRYTQHWQS